MAESRHEEHIGRHLVGLVEQHDPRRIEELLDRTGLRCSGEQVRGSQGGRVSDEECGRYLATLGEMFGVVVRNLATVNFILAGCRCAAAAAPGPSKR